jgi:nucleoside-diphosphate-sugar epimerase
MFWKYRKVIVTVGAGFLGSFVDDKLKKLGAREIMVPRTKEYDLTKLEAIKGLLSHKLQIVIHHVKDAAEAILLATELYDSSDPVNAGSGHEISICDLASLIAKLTGFKGHVEWHASKPGGQPSRSLDTSKAKRLFGFEAKTSLQDGLKQTIKYFVYTR